VLVLLVNTLGVLRVPSWTGHEGRGGAKAGLAGERGHLHSACGSVLWPRRRRARRYAFCAAESASETPPTALLSNALGEVFISTLKG
jgi:hypothetical protein